MFTLCGCLFASVAAHDLFLKLDTFFLRPHSKATVSLMNGTFRESEGAVARERLRDVIVVSPSGQVARPPDGAWRDDGATTRLDLETGGEGTYVLAVSTVPREIDLKAKDFNEYLEHDGLPDVLAARRKAGELDKGARERYSKHVKAVLQVGEARTETYAKPLGYPAEITPRQNPYSLRAGRTLEVLCTLAGKPVANQYVLSGFDDGARLSREVGARTDARGVARVKLTGAGRWYVKMIHMSPSAEPGLDYESKWATLTFEVR
ncbi:MAG TPA: DUF4198 domain-containing protein [Pyrinomonadaceae bacterium]|nr:DUF4198 domain-containing protein [Pyrinomonadaceae bacterium]